MRLSAIVPATGAPPALRRCVDAIRAAEEPPEELVVVEEASAPGPAAARNEGARRASGDVLVFVDADVIVHRDAFRLVRAAFAREPRLDALFGAYDDEPEAAGLVSRFRNLLHHHVHVSSAGPATTFWAGLGAVRREAFLAAGGFDAARYPRPSIEDVELGLRLTAAGARIELDPRLRGTHLKAWTLLGMIRSDLLDRGVPWVSLLLERRTRSSALNLGSRHRASAAASVACLAALAARRPRSSAAAAAVLVVLNARFYALLARRLGAAGAVAGVGLHAVHHLTAVAALPAGALAHALGRRGRGRRSHVR